VSKEQMVFSLHDYVTFPSPPSRVKIHVNQCTVHVRDMNSAYSRRIFFSPISRGSCRTARLMKIVLSGVWHCVWSLPAFQRWCPQHLGSSAFSGERIETLSYTVRWWYNCGKLIVIWVVFHYDTCGTCSLYEN